VALLRFVAVRRTIPQRDLRNNIASILREAEAGTVFTVTVRGRPVAQLGPTEAQRGPRTDVDRETIRRMLELPLDSAALAADVDAAEAPLDDPWPDA
jgi:prevent-host-death family protein